MAAVIYVCCGSCPLDGWVDESMDLLIRRWVIIDGLWRCPFCRRPL